MKGRLALPWFCVGEVADFRGEGMIRKFGVPHVTVSFCTLVPKIQMPTAHSGPDG